MKIVIDISADMYNDIQKHLTDDSQCYALSDYELREVIRNGKSYEERPIGHWKDHRWCSNCGCGIPTDVYGGGITEEEAHFCVECGARMEAEND